MSDDLNTEIKIGADASGVEAGVSRAKRSLADLGNTAKKAGKEGGEGIGSIGAGGDKAAQAVERSTKNMQGQIQRLIASFEGGERGSRQFYESLARQRGVDTNALKPLLDQLDAVKSKSMEAAKATTQVGSSFSGLGASAGLAARGLAALGVAFSAGEFIKLADASTNVASRLGLVTSSAAELISVQNRLFDVAQKSRVSFVDLVGTYSQMARSTKELGVSQGALLGVVETISQAVTISGGSAASAQAALVQLSQGFASGALRGDELNSILEQTPRLAQAMADGLGVGVGKLRELGAAGELTAEKVLGALEKSAGNVSSEFEKMTMTVGQASTKASNSVLQLVGAFDKMFGATKAISGSISAISKGIDFLAGDVSKLAGQGGLRDVASEVLRLDAAARNLRTGMKNGVFNPNAQRELDRINSQLALAKQRFRELDQQLGGIKDPRDQSGYTSRGQSYANEAKRQAGLAEDLNKFRLNLAGIPASYTKDMAELIRLNQAGVLVGKEYNDALKQQQDTLLKKTGVVKASGAAASQEQNAYASLVSSISQKIEAEKLELAGGDKLTASQRERIKLDADIASGRVKLTASEVASARAQLDMLEIAEKQNSAAKEAIKIAQALEATRNKEAMSAAAGIQSINDKAQALEDEIAVYGMGAQAIAALTIERLEEKKAILSGFGASADVIAQIEAEIEARGRLSSAKGMKDGMDESAAAAKKALAELDAFLDPAKASSFGDALTSAFEGAGNALAGMVNHLDSYAQKEAEIAKMRAKLSDETDPAQRVQKEMALANLAAKAQINAYASMAGAAKGFFKEGSTGYKTMGAVEKTYRAAELAMAVKNMAVKMGLIGTEVAATVAAQGSMTAASNASEAARMPAKIAGTFAAFTSMMGPFGIPAAIAALAAIGIAASGSSSNTLPDSNMGTGTVFGDASAKSESIEKTIDLLEGISKFAGIENSYAAKMLASLRSIEQQIGGFTNVILRSGGIELSGAAVQPGYSLGGRKSTVDMLSITGGVASGVSRYMPGHDSIMAKLFGTKTSITGQGIYAGDASLRQISEGGLQAGYYTDVNQKKKFLGMTTSQRNDILKNPNAEISRQISQIITNFEDAVKQAGPVLGSSLDIIDGNLQDFILKIGRIDLKDLSGTEIQEKLNAVFGAAGDDIARAAMPGLEHLQAVGEGYFETLARVASNLSSVNQMFDTLGVKLFDASIAGAEASLAMAGLFGGLENMASVVGDYYEAFYSEEERMAKMTAQLTAELAKAGVAMPTTKDAYRAIVTEALNAGEAGQELAAKLLQLNGAFSEVTDYAAAAAAAISQAALDAAAAQKQLLAQYRPMDVAGATKQIADAGVTINVPNLLALGSQGIRDAMADYISTLTDTTDAGVQQMIATLGNLTPAFGVLISAAETAEAAVTATASATAALASTNLRIQDQIDLLTGKETERSLAIRDAVDDSTKALLGTLYDLKDAADIAPVVDSAASSLENLGNTLERFGESLSLRLDFAKFGGGANPFLSAAGELQAAPNLTLSGGAVPVQNANDGGQFVQLSQWLKNEVAAVNSYVDQQQAAIAAWPDDRGAQFFDANAAASMLPYAAKAFELGASTFKAYFASLGGFALDLEKQLATANNTAIGSALNLVSISKYFSDLATEMADIQTELGKIAAMAAGGLTLDAATSGFANLIGGAATSVSAAITASILDKVPDAIKNDPKLAGVSTSILSVLGAVKKDDVQGLNDGFLLLSGSLTRGELSAAQYETALGYLTGAFKGAAEAITEEANKLQAVIDALAGVNRDIARFGMTSFETALLEIQDRADEAATAFGSMAPEIVALAVAERELLNLRNATTAKTTLDGLALDVSRLNMSPLEKELAGITDRADEYVRGLRDIGQATESNIASVGAWADAMSAAAQAADAAALRTKATDDAFATLERAVGAQRDLLNETIQDLQAVFDMTRDAARDLYGEVDTTRAMQADEGRAFIATAAALAKAGGVLPDQGALSEATAAARADTTTFASQADADFEKLVLAGQLKVLADLAGPQLTEAEALLAATNDAYEVAKTQLDTLRGIDNSVLSVAAAVEAFQVAFTGEQTARQQLAARATTAGATAGFTGPGDFNPNFVRDQVAYATARVGQLESSLQMMRTAGVGASYPGYAVLQADIASAIAVITNAPTAAAQYALNPGQLPSFAIGTNYVPRDMLAQIHEGEMIVPKAFNPATSGMSGNTERLERLVEGLTAEVQRLQAVVSEGNRNTRRAADTLDNVTEGGNQMRTVAA